MKELWYKLSNAGITDNLSYEITRKTRLMNLISLFIAFLLIFYFLLNEFTGKAFLGLIELAFACLFSLNIFLNQKKQYALATSFFLIELYTLASIVAIFISPNRNNEYIFMVISVIPMILFNNKKIVNSLFVVSLSLFIITKITIDGVQDFILYINYTLLFFLLFYVVKYLKDEFENHRNDIETKNLQLEKLNAEKNQLISIASHDLRSPLNRIQSLLSLLSMEGSLNHEQQEILRTTQQEAKHQSEMIGEILDLYAHDEGRTVFTFAHVEIPELIIELVKSFQSTADKKKIKIQIESKSDRIHVLADKFYLHQVFENLLSNALKFSYPNSQITISMRSSAQTMIISFKDEGQGLDEEDMKKLFKRFQRLSARPTAGETSSGLGLSIAKKYTEAMKGSLTCISEKRKGATFTVELPLA